MNQSRYKEFRDYISKLQRELKPEEFFKVLDSKLLDFAFRNPGIGTIELRAYIREIFTPKFHDYAAEIIKKYDNIILTVNDLYSDLGVDISRDFKAIQSIEQVNSTYLGKFTKREIDLITERTRKGLLDGLTKNELAKEIGKVSDAVKVHAEVLGQTQIKVDMGSNMVPIPPDSALIIRYQYPMILLTVLKSYIRKEFSEESWSSFLEIFGEPYIWAEYPIGLSDAEKLNLEKGVLDVGASARGIVPAGTKINITESQRSTSDHRDYKEDIKTEISLALLGHEKASGGTRSGLQVGQNQDVFRVTQHIAIDDMDFIEEETQQFIKMLINRNFKDIKRFPQLAFDKSDAADPKDKLTAAQLALNAGGQIDASFWEDFGVPLADKTKPLSLVPMFPGDRIP